MKLSLVLVCFAAAANAVPTLMIMERDEGVDMHGDNPTEFEELAARQKGSPSPPPGPSPIHNAKRQKGSPSPPPGPSPIHNRRNVKEEAAGSVDTDAGY
ncbi:hypothetical protein FDECE_11428 [Fusarium decemcellulare]|nr:hypothetical protein FDECE_11428 [Fusarium decemcellulare]